MSAKSKDEDKVRALGAVDPAVEARVDAMMNADLVSPQPTKPNIQPETIESSSAPLLPKDKLPNLDSIQEQKTETQPASELKLVPTEPDPLLTDKTEVNNPATEKVVDEIVQEESDRMLAIEDAKAELVAEGTAELDRGLVSRIKSTLKNFWANKNARYATIFTTFAILTAIFVVPTSRYFILNAVGVRVSSSLKIIDNSTKQPLKNVEVTISGISGRTDIDGNVKLQKLKLGPHELIVKKPAFADYDRKVTLGWGSNPLAEVGLTAVGSRYSFELKDFLSGKPVTNAEAISGEASAKADQKGEIVLVVADQDKENIDIEIISDKYRSEKARLPVGEKQVQKLKLVPNRKHAFVSKRSGKYDLYKIDVDGKNEEKILAGTGSEREENIVILPHSTKNVIAFVSARGDRRNGDGFALSILNIINLENNKINQVAESERIQLVDFIGDKLVLVKIAEGASAADPLRHRLVSLDIESNEKKELASTNYFNDVLSANGVIYYTPAQYKVNGSVGLFKINPDGTNRSTILAKEVWNLFRVAYEKINASVGQDWYEYDTGNAGFNKLGGAPSELKSRVYVDSNDAKLSAWVDERDGKGVLVIYDKDSKKDKVLVTQSGLQNPIRWLDDDHIVYRVSNSSETADYVVSLSGGEAKKIVDTTNTAGLDRWYYY